MNILAETLEDDMGTGAALAKGSVRGGAVRTAQNALKVGNAVAVLASSLLACGARPVPYRNSGANAKPRTPLIVGISMGSLNFWALRENSRNGQLA